METFDFLFTVNKILDAIFKDKICCLKSSADFGNLFFFFSFQIILYIKDVTQGFHVVRSFNSTFLSPPRSGISVSVQVYNYF